MSDYLCLRFIEHQLDAHSVVSWSILTASAQIVASGQTLLANLNNDIADNTTQTDSIGRTIVIVPASAALLTEAALPSGQRKHLKQILPFLIEDQIIDPVESMHIAAPVLHDADAIPVVAVARRLMAQWLDQLNEVGVSPDYLLLDACCVPTRDGRWQVMLDGDNVLIRTGRYAGLSVPASMAESLLRMTMNQKFHADSEQGEHSKSPEISHSSVSPETPADNTAGIEPSGEAQVGIVVADERDHALLEQLVQQSARCREEEAQQAGADAEHTAGLSLEEVDSEAEATGDDQALPSLIDRLDSIDRLIRSDNINTTRTHYSETASELLAVSAVQSLDFSLNLLQGDFRPANANAKNRRVVQQVSIAIAASLGFFLVITLGGGFYLNWRADSYFDQSVAIYRDLFPKQRKVIDPVKQMKRQLSGQAVGATTSEFLPLLDAASRSLAALEEQSSKATDIKQLRYDIQRGNIAIDIHASDIDELEAYKDLLASEGLSVDILSANQDGGVVKGRLQIGRS